MNYSFNYSNSWKTVISVDFSHLHFRAAFENRICQVTGKKATRARGFTLHRSSSGDPAVAAAVEHGDSGKWAAAIERRQQFRLRCARAAARNVWTSELRRCARELAARHAEVASSLGSSSRRRETREERRGDAAAAAAAGACMQRNNAGKSGKAVPGNTINADYLLVSLPPPCSSSSLSLPPSFFLSSAPYRSNCRRIMARRWQGREDK